MRKPRSVLFLKTATGSIEFGQNGPGGDVKLRHENDMLKFAEYTSTMWGVTFSLTTTDDHYISSVLSTCECRIDLRFLAGSPMPADIHYCEDHQFYNPMEFKSSGPGLSAMAADVAIYTAEHHTAEVDISWKFTMTRQKRSPEYVSGKHTVDTVDLLSELNMKRMEIVKASEGGSTSLQSRFTADLILHSGREAIDGNLLPADREAVQAFVEFCANNEVRLPLSLDENGRKLLEASDRTEVLECLDEVSVNTCHNALESFLAGRFKESVPTIRTFGSGWALFISKCYPNLYDSLNKAGLIIIEPTTPEMDEEKKTSSCWSEIWRMCTGLGQNDDEDTIISKCARYVNKYN